MFKKIAIALLAVLFLHTTVYAAPPAMPIEIYINQKKIESDVAPIIYNGRTLVPIRVISEHLGAAVHWDDRERTVRVASGEKLIILKINDTRAFVNQKPVTLDVPAMIVKNRTMVPLRFLGEYLGAKVSWDDVKRRVDVTKFSAQILDFSYSMVNEAPAVVIKGNVPLEYSVVQPDAGNLVVVDINAELKTQKNILNVYDGYVDKVIAGTLGTDSPASRFVIEAKDGVSFDILRMEQNSLAIVFSNALTSIEVEGGENLIARLKTVAPAKYRYFTIGTPEKGDYRLVVDIFGTRLSASAPQIPENNYVKAVRMSQFAVNPDTVRVVFDLKGDAHFQVFQNGGAISVNFSPIQALDDIRVNSESDKTVVKLELTGDVGYEARENRASRQLELIIPGVAPGEGLPGGGRINVGDGIVENIEILKTSEEDHIQTVVTFNLTLFTGYKIVSPPVSSTIEIEIYRSPLKNRIIVLDPGHGGSDPGAVHSGVSEKNLNLDIALRLKKLLEENGAKVLMTRESDIYVNLYTRAGIANEVGADLFVSIHNNASSNAATSGTMTLYYPTPEKKAFAQTVHKAVVETLGLPNLGLVERPNLVVIRETRMPSALVEVAFMTNKHDLALLQTEGFRQKVAEGVFKGIYNYLSGQ
ncbi:N-acetylmuramoyl-L-alanine amidase [Thermosediminibacter litoriperuensis]|uniref:N-acetylmuramoyl-L-alanine amidase n=1 Tax=Thermosediminibacter litoriperuensis TaxID=291989 RepID=A0A5S5AK86_9FIRM|nr:N-acetylmuramoyl-L-alanine amidase [Thermosediminibacter litoriperuensis]TYP51333.1 N-acetylmuramoyl-L-alanine amidase [Thermosediminibacter litoriperuensis]